MPNAKLENLRIALFLLASGVLATYSVAYESLSSLVVSLAVAVFTLSEWLLPRLSRSCCRLKVPFGMIEAGLVTFGASHWGLLSPPGVAGLGALAVMTMTASSRRQLAVLLAVVVVSAYLGVNVISTSGGTLGTLISIVAPVVAMVGMSAFYLGHLESHWRSEQRLRSELERIRSEGATTSENLVRLYEASRATAQEACLLYTSPSPRD